MQVGIHCIWHTAVLTAPLPQKLADDYRSWLGKKQKINWKKEKSRLSDIASEQLTPELSQGVLVARHVDRPWQVAWVHVAQSELLLYSRYAEKQRERSREIQKKRSMQFWTTAAISEWVSKSGSLSSQHHCPFAMSSQRPLTRCIVCNTGLYFPVSRNQFLATYFFSEVFICIGTSI